MDPLDSETRQPASPEPGGEPSAPRSPLPPVQLISFAEIANGRDEVWIELNGQIYRLRKTRNGKLILNK